jgi:UDP-N-acetylglucosamine 2-epimerase (non-hydrolysing)
MKICFILGTRPEIIKLYSVMKAALVQKKVEPVFVHTGQHYDHEMSQVFLEELKLPQMHHFLNVGSGTHGQQTAALHTAIEKVLQKENPDVAVVVGDTNTALVGALVAAKLQISVAHVEAGCRSFDLHMPEEVNRLAVDAIASVFFAPSEVAALNLFFEGKPVGRVFQAGNTIVDIVEEAKHLRKTIHLDEVRGDFSVLVTLHRQENVDDKERLKQLLEALSKIKGHVLFPIHPRTKKRIGEFGLSSFVENIQNLTLIKPQNYLTFMKLLEEAKVVITDSGGVQEEAIIVGTPCVTARDTTEWPETVWAGGNYLAGPNAEMVTKFCNELLAKSSRRSSFKNPFKGGAGPEIIQILVKLWREDNLHPQKPNMSGGKYPLPQLLYGEQKELEYYYTSLTFDKQGFAVFNEDSQRSSKVVRRSKQ